MHHDDNFFCCNAEDILQKRLVDRVPLQYLTASAFWRDMIISVGRGVLIPRPETELMIDYVIEACTQCDTLAKGAWIDAGTGSGALSIGIARALPEVQVVWALDIAPEPLKYVQFNAKRYGVSDRVRVVQSNWFDSLIDMGISNIAGIISNPPYISKEDMKTLQAEVSVHEPSGALDGGQGLGIDALMPICRGAARLLQPGGFLALETAGGEQAQYVAHVLEHLVATHNDRSHPAFGNVSIRRDLRGVARFVLATKSC